MLRTNSCVLKSIILKCTLKGMKEIKVKIVSQCGNSDGLYKIEVKPLETIYCPLNCGKTYKLVEDIPTILPFNFKIASFKRDPLVHISDTVEYCKKDVENTTKLCMSTTYGVFNKARVQFNGNATILEIGDFKTVVKCHEEDFFTEHVGLGLALNRYYKKKSKEINVLTFYIEDYTKLAEFCLWKFVNYDKKQFKQLLAKITNCEKGKWIEL